MTIPSVRKPFFELVVLNSDAPKPNEVVQEINRLKIFPVYNTISVVIKIAVEYHEPNIW